MKKKHDKESVDRQGGSERVLSGVQGRGKDDPFANTLLPDSQTRHMLSEPEGVAESRTRPPSVGPPSIAPPSIAPPSIAPPSVGPPSIAPPSIAPPTVPPPSVDAERLDDVRKTPSSVAPGSLIPPVGGVLDDDMFGMTMLPPTENSQTLVDSPSGAGPGSPEGSLNGGAFSGSRGLLGPPDENEDEELDESFAMTMLPPSDAPDRSILRIGTITVPPPDMGDRYQLRRQLAAGATGTVWLGRDVVLEREVAVKILHQELQVSEQACERFAYEARLTGALAHPGVVPVYDLGKLSDGRWYFAMQRIEGSDLEGQLDSIEKATSDGEEYPLRRLLTLFAQICMTMAYAHDSGFIHRDLKPANILVGNYGEVFVADWGLAKVFGAENHPRRLQERPEEEQGTLLGTLRYMSAEQLKGEVDNLTPKSDSFGLGVILYELLSLQMPFEGRTIFQLIDNVTRGSMVPLRRTPGGDPVPAELAKICGRALSPDPHVRPTAGELGEGVNIFLEGIQERIRSKERAAASLAQAKSAVAEYHRRRTAVKLAKEGLREQEEVLHERDVSDEAVGSGIALEPLIGVWRRLRQVQSDETEVARLYARAVQILGTVLQEQDIPDAHALLAELYVTKYRDAIEVRDYRTAVYFKSMVKKHDDGRFAAMLSDDAPVQITVHPAGAIVSLERIRTTGPLHLPERWSMTGGRLPVGSYRLVAAHPGYQTLHFPFVVDADRLNTVNVSLAPDGDGIEGFIYVHGGRARLGGDVEAPGGLPATEVNIDSFYMGRYPVTLGEYVEFLDALAETDVEAARGHAPRSPEGRVFVDYDAEAGCFVIPTSDGDGDSWDPRWPALMVSHHDTTAYCAWRSARDGRAYRLPTEFEWEYAARGADQRAFPWGNGFDANVACSARAGSKPLPKLASARESAKGRRRGPAKVDEFPYDVSPFGVRHMGGLVIEWTGSEDGADRYIVRGGGLFSTPSWCRAAKRGSFNADWLAVQFGFRLVVDGPKATG